MAKRTILLADDNPSLLELTKEILETNGYDVIAANHGAEALHLLSLHNISLVITDILMPVMDGYSLCYNMRSEKKYKDIPVIIYSATYISQNDEKLAMEIGADAYVRKPAKIEDLLVIIKQTISRPRKEDYKTTPLHELAEVTRIYNSRLIEKLETRNKELEQAKQDLLKSETRSRALVENLNDAVSLHDEKGNVLYQSPSVQRITGYSQAEAKGKSIADFFHPDDIPAILSQLNTVVTNPGVPVPSQKRLRHKDGHYIWTEGTTTNLLHDENVRAIVASFRDVTKRKKAEETIEHNEKRFRALTENNFDAVSLFDENGMIQYISPGGERMLGITKEEAIGQPGTSFFHPDDVADILNRLETALENPGKPIFRTNRLRHKDGHYLWVEGTTTNLLADENVKAFAGNFKDITGTIEKRKQIEFEHNNLDALINNTRDLMWSVDRNYNLITANKAFDDIIISMTGAAISKGSSVLMGSASEEQAAKYRALYDRAFLGEIFKITEYTEVPSIFWSELSFYPIREGNKIVGTACYSHNITEQKLAAGKIAANEIRIEAERKKFSDLFLQAPSCICILKGEDHTYEMANPLYLELTGKKDVVGKTAKEVFPELAEQGFVGLLNNVYQTGTPLSGKEVFIQIDLLGNGVLTDHYMDFVYQPYKDEDGKTEGIFFFANLVTEQVLARQKVEQNEKHFRALVENASDLIVVVNETGDMTYVSPAHEKLTGCKPADVIGKSFFSFQHPDNVPVLQAQFKELLDSPGIPIPRISRFKRKDGTYVWVQGTVTNCLHDANVNGIIGNFRDVTAHKLADEKIIHANRLYAFISQINQTIVHATNQEELFKEACRIAIEVGKYKIAWIGFVDIVHRKVSLVEEAGITSEDKKLFHDVDYSLDGPQDTAIKTGAYYVCNDVENDFEAVSWLPFARQYAINSCMVLPIRKFGNTIATFNLYSREVNLFDQQEITLLQEVAGDISYALDVFEKEKHRKQMEERIRHSELRLKQAQSIAHFGSWELDYETGIAIWSEEFCRIYGLSTRDTAQNYASWISFIHPDDLAHTKQVTNDARRASSGFAFHHRIIRKDGAIRYIFSQAEFEFDADGQPISLHGVAHDITEMKEAENERSNIIADMVQRNSDLEQFSYIISHNLRGPVANIMGLVNIMKDIGLDKEEVESTTEFLDTAVQNLDRVITDLNEILGMKNNAGLKREPINFKALLKQVKLGITDIGNGDHATITGDFSAVEEMTTIKSYMYSIFFNLIMNSIKYRRPNVPPVIEIRSTLVNNKIHLIFKDNGLGIDLKKSGDNVFRLYKRFHHHVEGKGMGLFMVKTQVDLLGGRISVVSEVNNGSEFTIEFDNKDKAN